MTLSNASSQQWGQSAIVSAMVLIWRSMNGFAIAHCQQEPMLWENDLCSEA
jgi:hypothetical protein